MNEILSNQITLSGTVAVAPVISHKVYGEEFLEFQLHVRRTSGFVDVIPVTISKRLISENEIGIDDQILIEGQIRTYNRIQEGKNKLIITVFARKLVKIEYEDYYKDENIVILEGYICRPPLYRVSPLGREISDVMIAVNRMYGKSDYVPCIAWGRNAKFTESMSVGKKMKIIGRIQSREYKKRGQDGQLIPGIAREISIHKIETEEN